MPEPTSHPLDTPIWTALSTQHAPMSLGDGLAKRYATSVLPFADLASADLASWRALNKLLMQHGRCVLIRSTPFSVPDFISADFARGIQMIAEGLPWQASAGSAVELTDSDIPSIMALSEIARPGPITTKALRLGRFWGIKRAGRLVAMAGERFSQRGYTEIAGVCTHPDYRGQRLADTVTCRAAAEVFGRGSQPYLHVYDTNAAAIALYRKLGFNERIQVYSATVG